jgi:formylglycine-generating enzyme
MRRFAWALCAASFAAAAGCSLLLSDDLSGGRRDDAGTETSSGADSSRPDGATSEDDAATDSGATTSAPCGDGGRGPLMIDAGSYCIDATEVTQAQYAAFLADKAGNTSGQPPECSWNTTYSVAAGCLTGFDPSTRGNHPIAGVDWCDALAYCAWAGKRLCGALDGGGPGGAGGSALPREQLEWFDACSNHSDGLHKYPYGGTYLPTACNGPELDAGGTVAVGSLATCFGGLPGLADMMGNTWEWANTCEPPDANAADQGCTMWGGSFSYALEQIPCGTGSFARSHNGCDIGFRCCAAP